MVVQLSYLVKVKAIINQYLNIVKSIKIKLVLTIFVVMLPIVTKSQENNIITIEEVYNHIIVNQVSNTRHIVSPSPKYLFSNGHKNQNIEIINSTKVKNIITEFNNEWEYLMFSNMTITEIDSDHILVTGIISGKNMEKGMINHMAFQHTWLLENGVLIKFIQ